MISKINKLIINNREINNVWSDIKNNKLTDKKNVKVLPQ